MPACNSHMTARTGECYICCEAGAPPSPCSCKDRFLHASCREEQVRVTQRAECTVCLSPFPETPATPISEVTRWQPSDRAAGFVLTCFSTVPFATLASTMWGTHGVGTHLRPSEFLCVSIGVLLVVRVNYDTYSYLRGAWQFWEPVIAAPRHPTAE